MDYKAKYIKYKLKYHNLKKLSGGTNKYFPDFINNMYLKYKYTPIDEKYLNILSDININNINNFYISKNLAILLKIDSNNQTNYIKLQNVEEKKQIIETINKIMKKQNHQIPFSENNIVLIDNDVKKIPITDIDKILTTYIKKVPTTDVEKVPTTDVEKVPTTDVEKEPTTDVEKVPTTDVEKEPTTDVVKEPYFTILIKSKLILSQDDIQKINNLIKSENISYYEYRILILFITTNLFIQTNLFNKTDTEIQLDKSKSKKALGISKSRKA